MNSFQELETLFRKQNGLAKSHEDAVFHELGNVFIKVMDLPLSGMSIITHAHKYPHITAVVRGSVKLLKGDTETVYKAPSFIDVEPGVHHGMVALEDDTMALCIHDISRVEKDDLGTEWS